MGGLAPVDRVNWVIKEGDIMMVMVIEASKARVITMVMAMVMARVAMATHLLVVTTNPLLSAAAVMPTALAFTRPLYLKE